MNKPKIFRVLANINLAKHFLDFGVLDQDNNCFELSEKGYENLCIISSSPLKSGIEWCHEGESKSLTYSKTKKIKIEAISQNHFPGTIPCPMFRSPTCLVIKQPSSSWVNDAMYQAGYAAPEKIRNRMLALYPVLWGKIDSRCLNKGKLGEKYRCRQVENSLVRVFVYQNSFWITTGKASFRGLLICSKIGKPNDLPEEEIFPRRLTFQYKFLN